jgi:hypothetical protein
VYGQAIFLTRQSTRPSVLLPFHLMWFGGLSKRQGAIALQKGLIVPGLLNKSARSGRTVRLTSRGRRGLGDILVPEEPNIPRVFAQLLKEWGHVTEDHFYISEKTPLLETWKHRKNEG